LIIHRGGIYGVIIIQVYIYLLTPDMIDIHFISSLQIIELEYIQNEEIPNMIYFQLDGRIYYWKDYSELVNMKTGDIIIEFIPS
jgi:hypothetical protein